VKLNCRCKIHDESSMHASNMIGCNIYLKLKWWHQYCMPNYIVITLCHALQNRS